MSRRRTEPKSKRAKFRRSRQRERILELLRATGSHPTAEWLYGKLRREFRGLSMGTIYRNLGILAEQGLVGRIVFGSTFDRFDANVAPHYHFICEKCGDIIDLDLPVDPRLNHRLDGRSPHRVRRHELEFYGLCEKCSSSSP